MSQEDQREANVRQSVSFKSGFYDEIQKRISEGSFSSLSDYLRHAARIEMANSNRDKLDAILLARIDDQQYEPVSDDDLKGLKADIEAARARRNR